MIEQQQPSSQKHGGSLRHNRTFMIFWGGQSLSFLGSGMAFVAFPLLVFASSHSVQVMGLATALMGLGSFLAGLVSGVLADRYDRRRLLLLCDACSAAGYAAIPLCWWLLGPQVWLLLLVALSLGFFSLAATVASTASLTRLVEPTQLVAANARLQSSNALAFVLGPILTGVLIGVLGSVLAPLTFNAISYLFSVLSLLLIRLRPSSAEAASTKDPYRWATWLAGVRFLLRHSLLGWVVILRIGEMLLLAGIFDLVVYRVRHELGQTDVAVGILWGLGALGAIAGGALAPRLRHRLGFGLPLLGGLAIQALSFLAIGFLENLPLLFVCGLGVTFGDILVAILGQALIQEQTPDVLQGRVTAALQTGIWLATAAGAAASTSLAATLGRTTPVFVLTGLLMLALTIWGLLSPACRRVADAPASAT
jgi:MFS family permease